MDPRGAVAAAMQRLLQQGDSRAVGAYVQVAGTPLHYLEEGGGPPVVLIHGGSGGGANWFRLLRGLAPDFRVLAPDLPGFGLSPRRSPVAPLGRQTAGLLAEWMDAIGVADALVVGTSFGGLAALRLAQVRPGLVGRLLLLDAAGLTPRLSWLIRVATIPGLAHLTARSSRRGTALLFRTLLTSDRSRMTRAMQRALVDYLHASAVAAGPAYVRRTLTLFAGPRGQREYLSEPELRALRQPTVIAAGALDPFFAPASLRRAVAVMPDAALHMIQAAGHSPNWEAPDDVLSIIRVLAGR
jgi:pimeloyl-ACP methyl ester carboxylesterase